MNCPHCTHPLRIEWRQRINPTPCLAGMQPKVTVERYPLAVCDACDRAWEGKR